MTKMLPTRLEKEPLIDAIFEVRFISRTPASVILPGFLFEKLDGKKTIKSLAASQIPKNMREADANLKFAPLSCIDWDKFSINIGDASVSISCKKPYPGWSTFKSAIINVINALNVSGIIESVDRYSMKYIDLIPSASIQEQVDLVDFDVTVAGHKLKKENFQLRIEITRDSFINIVQILSSGFVIQEDGTTKEGLIVDVDTISNQQSISMEVLLKNLSNNLDAIHHVNKVMFFDCIKESTINSLGPIYD